jgi:hypothetical protein
MTGGESTGAPRRAITGDARRREIVDVALLLALAAAVRLWWAHAAGALTGHVDLGEASHVALAVARGAGIADAFYDGQGPTAHLLPVSPAFAGALFRLFGYPSPAANLAVALWGIAQSIGALGLLYALSRAIGMRPLVARATLLIIGISPAMLAQEAADFRVWEGALGLCLALANLLMMLRFERAVTTPRLALAAGATGITFFVSPPAGLAIAACWGLYAWRNLGWRQIVRFVAFGLIGVALPLAPWTIRNAEAFGRFVPLRSNFGLELALANHDAALDGRPRDAIFNARIEAIHPFNSPAAAARVRQMGEIAYADALGAEAKRWIARHPAQFLRLTLRHYRQFYLPEEWQMRATVWRNLTWPRVVLIWLSSVLGLASLMAGARRGRIADRYLLAYVAIAGLPYAIVQPVPRYSYLVYGVLTVAAVRLVAYLATRAAGSIGMER